MTDESTLHAPPEALDFLQELVTKNRPSAIGAFMLRSAKFSTNRLINAEST